MTEDRAQAFLRFCQERSVLKFGQFTLKSGRSSPYFFNAGAFHRGSDLNRLAAFYAAAIVDSDLAFDGLFGPAYKGIPLVAAVAMELERAHALDCPWTFNRKEAKDHGEGGALVGAPLVGRILILDDVVTAGTAIREAIGIIRTAGAQPVGVALALDREERGPNGRSAVQELEAEAALRVVTVARFSDLVAGIDSMVAGDAGVAADVRRYRDAWGVAGA